MNLWYKPDFLAILFICIISTFALKDLTKPGLYTSHDGETHTARIAQYYQAIKDGQLPPRFAGSFYNGFGSPIFVYIYPAPYLIGSAMHLIGFSFVNSFKILMAIGFVASGIFSYLWLKELFKNRQAAIVGALYYAYSPYRLQLIYVRGSISEHLAYTFLPLALFSITRLKGNDSTKVIAFCSLAISAVLLSQNLVAFITLPLIILYAIFLTYTSKSLKILTRTFIAIIWAFAISAFTYIPALFERSYVKFDEVFKLVYGSHFVTFRQLLRSPWGYGFDLPGTVNDQMSFQIGLAHWLAIVSGLLLVTVIFIRKIAGVNKSQSQSKEYKLVIVSYLVLAAVIFLAVDTEITKIVWKYLKVLQIIDIPWRLLGVVPALVAIIATFIVIRLKPGIVIIFLVLALLIANRNHFRINKALIYTDEDFLNYQGTATQLSEFTPSERRNLSSPDFTDQTLPVNTAGGWAKYSNITSSSRKISFFVTVISDEAQIRINRFYFPGVKVKAYNDDIEMKDYTSQSHGDVRLDRTRDTYGFIYIPLTKGTYKVEVNFGETKLRYFADLASLAALAALLFYIKKNAQRV